MALSFVYPIIWLSMYTTLCDLFNILALKGEIVRFTIDYILNRCNHFAFKVKSTFVLV